MFTCVGVFLAQNEEEHEVSYEGTIKYTIGAALGNPSMRPKLQVTVIIYMYQMNDIIYFQGWNIYSRIW